MVSLLEPAVSKPLRIADDSPLTSDGKRLLTTGEMARQSGSTLRTVRFYEEEGLVQPKDRNEGGHRHFEPTELTKLRLALDLREAGLSISDIKKLFSLKSASEDPKRASAEMRAILETQIEEMQKKIATLRRLREELTSMVAVISECKTCTSDRFPLACDRCDVLDQPGLPRAVQVLWKD